MNEFVNVVVGYDEREAVAYHTCIESIISNSSTHINITPLCLKHFKKYRENHTDGSNEFIYSRFLVPYLFKFKGLAPSFISSHLTTGSASFENSSSILLYISNVTIRTL